jgi:hypothetical protein
LARGIFDEKFFVSLSKPEQARGLITFLFAVSTIAIITLIAITTFWMDEEEVQARSEKAKDLLTIIIGVLGTILGFHYGSLSGEGTARSIAVSNVTLSSYVAAPGDKITISATIVGGTAPYQYDILSADSLEDAKGVDALRPTTVERKDPKRRDSLGIRHREPKGLVVALQITRNASV